MDSNLPKAIFVGNGIHRVNKESSLSWSCLLAQLQLMPDYEKINLCNPLKPFPFAFEEFIHSGPEENEQNIKKLKQEVRKLILAQMKCGRPYNDFHKQIMNSKIEDVITSNYDYGFEMSVLDNFLDNTSEKRKSALNRLERTNSIFRGYRIPTNDTFTRVWHMHGELMDSRNHTNSKTEYTEQSIMLGFSHYGKYLSKIKDFVDKRDDKYGYILHRLANNKNVGDSWIDTFFTHNLDFLGFGLGFEEQDVWWLLNYRADKINSNQDRTFRINNRIRFFIKKQADDCENDNELCKDKIYCFKSDAVKEVLTAMHVEIVEIKTLRWPDFYKEALDNILN